MTIAVNRWKSLRKSQRRCPAVEENEKDGDTHTAMGIRASCSSIASFPSIFYVLYLWVDGSNLYNLCYGHVSFFSSFFLTIFFFYPFGSSRLNDGAASSPVEVASKKYCWLHKRSSSKRKKKTKNSWVRGFVGIIGLGIIEICHAESKKLQRDAQWQESDGKHRCG
jgi:hypothetical protein